MLYANAPSATNLKPQKIRFSAAHAVKTDTIAVSGWSLHNIFSLFVNSLYIQEENAKRQTGKRTKGPAERSSLSSGTIATGNVKMGTSTKASSSLWPGPLRKKNWAGVPGVLQTNRMTWSGSLKWNSEATKRESTSTGRKASDGRAVALMLEWNGDAITMGRVRSHVVAISAGTFDVFVLSSGFYRYHTFKDGKAATGQHLQGTESDSAWPQALARSWSTLVPSGYRSSISYGTIYDGFGIVKSPRHKFDDGEDGKDKLWILIRTDLYFFVDKYLEFESWMRFAHCWSIWPSLFLTQELETRQRNVHERVLLDFWRPMFSFFSWCCVWRID